MTLSLNQLQNYSNWVGRTPFEILNDVRGVGGWVKVFPREVTYKKIGTWKVPVLEFPDWASRVRNYFNDVPSSLAILTPPLARAIVNQYRRKWSWYSVAQKSSVSDAPAVYVGNNMAPWNFWITYANGGTVFHFPLDKELSGWDWPKSSLYRSRQADMITKSQMPIFKLVCPDGTGGSSEIVIHNHLLKPDSGKDTGGRQLRHGHSTVRGSKPGDPPVLIKNHLVIAPEYRGSYNYSETMVAGFLAHDYRDIAPDKVSSDPMHILWPPKGQGLASRKFPRLS